MTSWQKTIKYIAVAFAILLIVSIVGGIFSVIASLDFVFTNNNAEGETETYNINGEIDSLYINISAAQLEIRTDDDFRVESNNKYLTVTEKDGKLKISEKKRLFGSYSGKVKVALYIPENTVFSVADIVTGAGKVTVEDLSSQVLDMELGAGAAEIDSLNVNERADIDGGAGSIEIESGTINGLKLHMGVGELVLTSRLTGECELDYGIGSASLTLLGSKDDYRIDIDKGMGEAAIDGEKVSDGQIFGSGENRIEIDGGVGEMKIRFEE